MAQAAQPLPARLDAWRTTLALVAAVLVFGVALRLAGPGRVAGIQNFIVIFDSLLLEAMPFILLGAVIAAAIEVFVPAGAFERLANVPRGLQIPAAGIAGFAFPLCDCGSVPVARRLARKGLSPAAAVTFMLAAPILNPIVIASTVVAYRGRSFLWPMVLGRIGLGFVTAVAVGWVVGNTTKEQLLRGSDDHIEMHEHAEQGARDQTTAHEPRVGTFFAHIAADFVFMGKYLVIAATLAAGLQTLVPQSILGNVAEAPIVNIVAMMALASMLSLCSESDAFVAASFVQFGFAAQLAFLCFGPMIDTKLAFLYTGTFGPRFFRTVAIVVAAVTLVGTLWMQLVFG